MRRRDWAGTVLVACIFGLAGMAAVYWTTPVAAGLAVVGVASVIVIVLDVRAHNGVADLQAKCEQISADLFQFLADRAADDNWVPHWEGLPRNASAKRKNEAFEKSIESRRKYHAETMNRYDVRFAAKALDTANRLMERDMLPSEERFWFEHPTSPLGIEHVAQGLGVAAEQLKRR
jgi:hypothetical protein